MTSRSPQASIISDSPGYKLMVFRSQWGSRIILGAWGEAEKNYYQYMCTRHGQGLDKYYYGMCIYCHLSTFDAAVNNDKSRCNIKALITAEEISVIQYFSVFR